MEVAQTGRSNQPVSVKATNALGHTPGLDDSPIHYRQITHLIALARRIDHANLREQERRWGVRQHAEAGGHRPFSVRKA